MNLRLQFVDVALHRSECVQLKMVYFCCLAHKHNASVANILHNCAVIHVEYLLQQKKELKENTEPEVIVKRDRAKRMNPNWSSACPDEQQQQWQTTAEIAFTIYNKNYMGNGIVCAPLCHHTTR